MGSLRRLAWMYRELSKQHVENPDVPAAPNGADGYAEWVQIALILFRVELEKSLRKTEDYLNEMPGILAVFDLDEAPHYSSFCRWEQDYRMRAPPAPLLWTYRPEASSVACSGDNGDAIIMTIQRAGAVVATAPSEV